MFETRLTGTEVLALSYGRILVVDDDTPVRLALTRMLSDAGHDVHDVSSAREARYVLEHDTIVVLFSDVSMPDKTGLDLIRFALCEHPETATLLISGLDEAGIAQAGSDFGAHGYITKPVRRSEVLIGVTNALRRRAVEARERAARENLERTVTRQTRALSNALAQLERACEHGRAMQAQTLLRWAQSAEYRDPGIGRHGTRVSHCCTVLGRAFGLHAESLGLASVVHDVGKLAIPDSIVLKTGPLTAHERHEMQRHADIGYEMLRDSSGSLLDLAAVIARTHHEKFDGSGYPRGLSGENIPLEGRIAAVADVFDAMTCDRVYRPAWSVAKTTAWMQGERGKHFDPSVLDAFLSSTDEILAIRSA
jgi:putative two-component system response regulator